MLNKITQKDFIKEMQNWTGENVSFCSVSLELLNKSRLVILNQLNIKSLDDIKPLFDVSNIYEAVENWMIKENLKVEIKSNYLLLNNSRLDIKGKCFKYNDDILGVLSEHYLIIYYKNK